MYLPGLLQLVLYPIKISVFQG